MKQVVIGFGLLITALLALFKLAEYSRWQNGDNAITWLAIFSVVFFAVGIALARKLFVKKIIIKEEEPKARLFIDEAEVKKTGISKRELEILQLIDEGLSNQQIAGKLFVSEHTVKKHVSNLFSSWMCSAVPRRLKKPKRCASSPEILPL